MTRLLVVASFSLLAVQDPGQKYVLDFGVTMFPGRTFEIQHEESSASRVVYGKGFENEGETNSGSSRSLIAGTCEVLSWKRPADHEMRWILKTVDRVENGKAIRLDLLDKRIRLLIRPGFEREYSCEDGPRLGAADEVELDDIVEGAFTSPKKKAQPEKSETDARFSTVTARGVGESWTTPVNGFFDGFLEDIGGVKTDESKSEIKFTLVSVKERGGSKMATVKGLCRLVIKSIGPAILDDGFPMDMAMTYEGCLDGKSGHREYTVVVKGKGTVKVRMPGRLPAAMEFESQITKKRIRRDRR
jgi:hypothetical protein